MDLKLGRAALAKAQQRILLAPLRALTSLTRLELDAPTSSLDHLRRLPSLHTLHLGRGFRQPTALPGAVLRPLQHCASLRALTLDARDFGPCVDATRASLLTQLTALSLPYSDAAAMRVVARLPGLRSCRLLYTFPQV